MSWRTHLLVVLCLVSSSLRAQDLEGIQIHGFATQGSRSSSNNNYLWMKSSSSNRPCRGLRVKPSPDLRFSNAKNTHGPLTSLDLTLQLSHKGMEYVHCTFNFVPLSLMLSDFARNSFLSKNFVRVLPPN